MNAILLTALMAVSGPQQVGSNEAPGRTAQVMAATLALIDEADVPAPSAGVLTDIVVKEGATVQRGAPLAQIDDREAQGKLRLARQELNAAEEEAKNDVRVRAAEAAQRVAEAELADAEATLRRAPKSVSATEIRRLDLSAERYKLEVEVAQKDLNIALITRDTKQTAIELTQLELDKLSIESPLDGAVVQVYKHRGEWVAPGDPIARVVRMDKLRVEGDINSELYAPEDLMGQPVTVTVRLPRDRVVRLEGKVTYVSPLVDVSKDFRVWAEFDNREENGFWLLRPGLRAEMAIHLK